jgi:hypothetical protein
LTLAFRWGRDVPTLYLVAEGDTALPLSGMYELFERTPATKKVIILRRADHAHLMDQVEQLHEMFRTMPEAGDLAAIQKEMQPMAELCSGELLVSPHGRPLAPVAFKISAHCWRKQAILIGGLCLRLQLNGTVGISPSRHIYAFLGSWRLCIPRLLASTISQHCVQR